MQYKNLLLPVDFSNDHEGVFARARDYVERFGCEVTLVHVIDYMPPLYIQAEIPANFASEESMVKKAKLHMQKYKESSGLKDCNIVVKIGNPKHLIPELQRESNFDLMIMAKHNHKGLERLVGSTTNSVLHRVTCDVLVIPG